jgi:hypothetical protein
VTGESEKFMALDGAFFAALLTNGALECDHIYDLE